MEKRKARGGKYTMVITLAAVGGTRLGMLTAISGRVGDEEGGSRNKGGGRGRPNQL